jgi:hypothetical protein
MLTDSSIDNFKSTFVTSGKTVFGKSTYSVIDNNWKLKEASAIPGPGQYGFYSEFANCPGLHTTETDAKKSPRYK